MISTNIFILTGEWNDLRGKNTLRLIGLSEDLGTVEIIINNVKPVFFIEHDTNLEGLNLRYNRKHSEMKNFEGKKVDVLYFNTQKELRDASELLQSKGIPTYESDIDPVRRYLMERFINAQINVTGNSDKKGSMISFVNPKVKPCENAPQFVIASLDIETGIKNGMLYSIAVHITGSKGEIKKVFIVGDQSKKAGEYISFYNSEKELLISFIEWVKIIDPDIITGWHVIGFDLMFLERKCSELNINLDLSRGGGRVSFKARKNGGYFAFIPGRIVIDGPPTLRSSFFSFEDYKLETVAQVLLKTGKTITPDKNKVNEIERLFKEDKIKLAEYNLQDSVLVSDIFKKSALIELSVKRSQLSGLLMDQLGMMTAAFDHFYLPRLHRAGYVAPNVKDIIALDHAAGGYVLDPKPGLYDDVIVLDFKSLYPSIIRTFKIDPIARLLSEENTLMTPEGYKFSSTKNFLPDFIAKLMEQRTLAKAKGDKQLSQAIKILMNSFYGVMGSYGCRFYHPDLPTAITSTGHYLLLGSKDYLQKQNYEVVYGDTDSLFVKLKDSIHHDKDENRIEGKNKFEGCDVEQLGEELAQELNNYWKVKLKDEYNVESFLEIEYEKYYRKFIITPARGSETGAKKRYAGMLVKNGEDRLEFVGMEFVRSDWTRLAKDFQVELYERIFKNMEIEDWLRTIVSKVLKGDFNDKLVYRKRLRKDIEEYTKNIPPQVRAARLIDTSRGLIYYVMTKRGPIPIELDYSDIDFQHYIDKQLKPVADSVLALFGTSFDSIIHTSQLSFFD